MHRLFDHQDIVAKKVQSAIVYKENERIEKLDTDVSEYMYKGYIVVVEKQETDTSNQLVDSQRKTPLSF